MTEEELARLALRVSEMNVAWGAESFRAENGTFYRDRRYPAIRDANHVSAITASTAPEIDALLARADREYAGIPHRRFDCDFTTPPAFEARLALDGYRRSEALLLVLEGELLVRNPPQVDVRAVDDESGWRAFSGLHLENWLERRSAANESDSPEIGEAMAERDRSGSPPMRYYLAHADGAPRAYFGWWEGIDGMAQVENLFTHPDYRHGGLATALIIRCVDECRAHGAGPVLIVADPTDTPMRMYASMGFRPLALKREWWRQAEIAGAP